MYAPAPHFLQPAHHSLFPNHHYHPLITQAEYHYHSAHITCSAQHDLNLVSRNTGQKGEAKKGCLLQHYR